MQLAGKTSYYSTYAADTEGRGADSQRLPIGRTWRRFLYSALRQPAYKFVMASAIAAGVWTLSPAAAAAEREVSDSATIHYSQSHGEVTLTMPGNRAELDRLTDFMRRYSTADSGYILRSVRVTGAASPEGSHAINERLSRRRAESIFDYIAGQVELPDSVATFEFIGRDWHGLRGLVAADPALPYRNDVLALIDGIIAAGPETAAVSDRGLSSLRALHSGVPYRYMYTRQFPALRVSKLSVEYEAPALPVAAVVPDEPIEPVDTITDEVIVEEVPQIVEGTAKDCKPFYMGLKTNMLYDALALPSIGAEFYIGKNWSVGANWTYGWWSSDRRHRYWRAYGGDINVRRWFGRKAEEKPLTGHHLGLYAGVVTYDFEFGGKGYMGGLPHRTLWDRCNYTGGIEYGYSLPVGRRLNIDFTIGVGYMGGKYLEYEPDGKFYVWQKTKRLNWFGPTKAEISLVWLIGCDNYNRSHSKGGRL